MLFNRILYFILLSLILVSCSTKKNTAVSRGYHNLTARYNGYYYSCVNIDDGIFKIEKANKDNFEKTLPVFIYPSPENAKATFTEFDKAIKKSSLCIQKHAIKDSKGNEIPSAGKWIDNNWINIGISHFYKREFFSGIESFEYVVRTYTKSKDKFNAMLWLAKSYNEIGSVSNSEPILSFLKNQRNLPSSIKKELPALNADYYIRRGQNTEAIARLMEATRNSNLFTGIKKKDRARYSFIVAQLLEQSNDKKRAVGYYKRTISLKPNYEMIFYSKIKIAKLLDVKRNSSLKTKKDLLKMAKEFKNTDYYDVIYYTLGEIEEKEKNTSQAIYYYKKSVQTSTTNRNQKALSFLRLGEINFDLTNYEPAEAYYDSTISAIPKDHPDYENILARKKTLETLVGHIKTISREDSLQRIAKMTEEERNAFIDKMIRDMEKEEERKQKELEALKNSGGGGLATSGGELPVDVGTQGAIFYFYNPNTVALGVSDFTKKWGNRKLEDNWRRSNKALIMEDEVLSNSDSSGGKGKVASAKKTRDFYKKDLPLNDTLIAKSNKKIIKAYYLMGSIYKEELNNTQKTIASFEELNRRYPDNRYLLNTYYILYRTYLIEKNQPKADFYKNKILDEFPDSEFALLIKNPDYALELNTKKSEVEAYYLIVYDSYKSENYDQSYSQAKEGISKFGKNDYLPKFELIKSLSYGKLKGVDSLEYSLKLLTAKYPNADVTPLANDILSSIKKQKNPEFYQKTESAKSQVDSFTVNMEAEHFIVAVIPDEQKVSDAFKINIGNFNTTYYFDEKLNISSNLFGSGKQLIVVKAFATAQICMNYFENLMKDQDIFKGDVKRETIEIYPMLSSNLPIFFKTKNVNSYKEFYNTNYKKFEPKK